MFPASVFSVLLSGLPTALQSVLGHLPRLGVALEVVGVAGARDLPALTQRLRPNVVVVSELQLSGLGHLQRQHPVPVLLYCVAPPPRTLLREAARLGVYDYLLPAPTAEPELLEWSRQAGRKLLAARLPAAMLTPPLGTLAVPPRQPAAPLPPRGVVVIGGSTGGGPAVEEILRGLPANFPWAVLVAVHLPVHFTSVLVDRLARVSRLPVVAAASGSPLRAGQVLVAPGGHHLVVRAVPGPWLGWQTNFVAENAPDVPSVDVLMRSVAALAGCQVVGLILTGLGHDGTAGARAIRQQGGVVVAQDAATATVFSMPKSVIDAGLASAVLPLSGMAAYLVRHTMQPTAPVGRRRVSSSSSSTSLAQ
ncbi:hypothetical protein CDA63_09775 [Hymenobacter amundsenii]|uniref:protein-glutamate methylesterase n=1 Tax=Hymenobacter amundsenii TaxID=2006685 RepID=A0A2D0AFZ8_9BACT|nr:hypothetical protein CDA63_09775 [Hymenobacter amundsenii]